MGLRFDYVIVDATRDPPRSAAPRFSSGPAPARVYESNTFLLLPAARVAHLTVIAKTTRAAVV